MKVALVHDWLTGMRGGERVLQRFLELYPQAHIFTLIHVPGTTTAEIDAHVVQTSFLSKFSGIKNYYRLTLPLFPQAIKQFNFDDYDLVISLSHAAAKNISVAKHVTHVCYCFTPMRYIWDQSKQYLGHTLPLVWPLIRRLRHWDLLGAAHVNHFATISNFVAARIRCFYRRNAEVIYPAVDTSWISARSRGNAQGRGLAFLYAGALVPYKRVDLVIEAFNKVGEELWIVGSGPEEEKLKRLAKKNVIFFGRVSDADLAGFYARCRALIFPAKEEFGLIPVECMAAGRPVIGLYAGALKETVVGIKPWLTGVNAREEIDTKVSGVFVQNRRNNLLDALVESVNYFLRHEDEFRADYCMAQAERFSCENFFLAWNAFAQRSGFPGTSESSDLAPKSQNFRSAVPN